MDSGRESDFGRDIFSSLPLEENLLVAYKTTEYIKDLGTEKRYQQVNEDYASGRIKALSLSSLQKAVFLDRDGTINRNVDLLSKPEQLELLPGVADAIRMINKSDYLAICVTNQSVVARNLCDMSQLKEIHNRLDSLLGEKNAFLDDLYFCPHHPDKGYPEENKKFKIDCNCRKPNPGMVNEAAEKYNIDLSQSWMIGDRTDDIQLAKNSGLKSILVRTGFAGKDEKYSVTADFVCNDLSEAVKTVLMYDS